LGAWELQELALALDRATRERSFRLFPVLLPGVEEPFEPNRLPHFLRARTWVDFRRGHDDARALQDLANAVRGVPFGPPPTVLAGRVDDVAPYQGLRAFGEEDARLFFGRDREVQRLLEKLKSSRFLAVVGRREAESPRWCVPGCCRGCAPGRWLAASAGVSACCVPGRRL
jgi:hypothetical protein